MTTIDANINLLVIAGLTVNSKLYVRDGQFEIEMDRIPWFMTSIKRYIFGDGREDIIRNLRDTVTNVGDMIASNHPRKTKLLENLHASLSGIQILKTCYRADIRTVARLKDIEDLATDILKT